MMKKKHINRTFYFICFIITFISFILPSIVKSSDLIELKIWADKNLYLTGEAIFINYEIKNLSDSLLFMNFTAVNEYFEIKDEKGNSYVALGRGIYIHGDSLKPYQSHQAYVNIGSLYNINQPGVYACYLQMPEGRFFPYTGTKSNKLEIKVKEPSGDEKKVIDLLLEVGNIKGYKDADGKINPVKRELRFQKLLEVVNKYPNSVYAPQILYSALGVYLYSPNLEERRKIIPVCKRLIEEYPESYYFMSAFTELVDTHKILKDKKGAIKTITELIEKHPDTKISEEGERRLKRIKEWKF